MLAVTAIVSAVSFCPFYAWASGPWLVSVLDNGLVRLSCADILIAALGAELFPTSHRSRRPRSDYSHGSSAAASAFWSKPNCLKLLGSHGPAIACLTSCAPLCLVPIWFLPEPPTKSLEDISAERTMIDVVSALIPVFAIIALGAGLHALNFMPEDGWRAVERITYFVLFPCFLFGAIAFADFKDEPLGRLSLLLAGAMIAMAALVYPFRALLNSTAPPSPASSKARSDGTAT